jgi:ABC-type nitrate/sulfonate/bicarbonate transport system permease component
MLLGSSTIALLLTAWWAACALELVSPFILPSPGSVVEAAMRVNGGYLGSTLTSHLQASVSVVLVGFLAAAIVGVPLGIAMAWLRPLDVAFGPVLSVLRPIPPPAWIPLSILWFGIGLTGKTFVVFIAAITPCLINSYVGIKQVPQELINAARTLGASQREQLLRVAVPSGLPFIVSGLRIGLSTAWASLVAAELVVATAGFGFPTGSRCRRAPPASPPPRKFRFAEMPSARACWLMTMKPWARGGTKRACRSFDVASGRARPLSRAFVGCQGRDRSTFSASTSVIAKWALIVVQTRNRNGVVRVRHCLRWPEYCDFGWRIAPTRDTRRTSARCSGVWSQQPSEWCSAGLGRCCVRAMESGRPAPRQNSEGALIAQARMPCRPL